MPAGSGKKRKQPEPEPVPSDSDDDLTQHTSEEMSEGMSDDGNSQDTGEDEQGYSSEGTHKPLCVFVSVCPMCGAVCVRVVLVPPCKTS